MNDYRLTIGCFLVALSMSSCKQEQPVQWVCTTEHATWQVQEWRPVPESTANAVEAQIFPEKTAQEMEGFGACFNELGWTSLSLLSESDRNDILSELFEPGKGANFTVCRMPVGANDFSRNWYSYNETPDDFEMKNFSIANDEETLIPFIRSAQRFNPALKIWASPWCPPSWMKHNKHYACRPSAAVNDLPGDPTTNLEGSDMFITEENYFRAYAQYFKRFIEAYRQRGISVYAVAPQNEFNSCQVFPSCTWTARSLAQFIGGYLGPEMEKAGVEILFGTIERADETLTDTVLTHPQAGKYIRSAGFQWAGKDAIAGIHKRYPRLTLYQTEQECGNGRNSWAGAKYAWNLTNHYISNGTGIYDYWNISLLQGGISRWGWAQNSLVTVNSTDKTYTYTFEYYVMKHYSHFVAKGAKRLETSGYEDLLAFMNPDKSIIVIAGNLTSEKRSLKIRINDKTITPMLESESFNTFVIQP